MENLEGRGGGIKGFYRIIRILMLKNHVTVEVVNCNDLSMPGGPLPNIFIFEARLLLFLHFL